MADISQFDTTLRPTWCPGCGLFTMKIMISMALLEMGLTPDNTVITYDIGCNGNGADKIKTYAIKSLHGRSIVPAIGIKYANQDLTVISIIGDGGMFWEGADHWVTAAQRNENVLVIVSDNQIYGLTTGQTSPTTPCGTKTISYPEGSPDEPMNPLAMSIAAGATFVARAWVGRPKLLKALIKEGIQHKGFAIIDVLTQCVTWTKIDMLNYYKDMVYGIEKDEQDVNPKFSNIPKHDPSDKIAALKLAYGEESIPLGVYYKAEKRTIYDKYSPLKKGSLIKQASDTTIDDLMEEFV